MNKKTIIYIDASNLMHADYKLDFRKLFEYFKKRYNPEKIIYFGAIFVGNYYLKHNFNKDDYLDFKSLQTYLSELGDNKEKEKIKKQLSFVKKLQNIGFRCKIKPLKIMRSGKMKGDCDVNITAYGMGNYKKYENVFLFSGDGDFLPFLRFLKKERKKIKVFSFGKNKQRKDSTANEIKKFLKSNWHDLCQDDFKRKFEIIDK